jgi:hypothetical protein
MPTVLITGACGDPILAASQVLAFAAYASALPTVLLDLSQSGPKAELIPSLSLSPEDAPRALRGLGPSVQAFIRWRGVSAEALAPLLPYADVVLVPTTRFAIDLQQNLGLSRSLKAPGRSGSSLEPWLLPVGWSSTRLPAIRARDWRRDLARLGEENLRCLPLILPWTSLGSVALAEPARLQAMGERMLRCLAAIAAGRAPERPEPGLDPWPAPPESSQPPLHLAVAGLRPRLRLVPGA